MSIARPALFTFDVFGTVLDWRTGLAQALGRPLSDAEFDAVVDRQGVLEQTYAPYAEIVARSLVDVLGTAPAVAAQIGRNAGKWPLFPDSREAMQRLRRIAPCVATTNSDVAHGADVRAQLGGMDGWICAEQLRIYKPDPRVWHETARLRAAKLDASWWHVSAYGDYDLSVARSLGLTCVFVRRPHARPGPCDVTVSDLRELAQMAQRL